MKRRSFLALISAIPMFPERLFNKNYFKMNTRNILSTSEKLPVIGVGTWQTFDVLDQDQKKPLREVLNVLKEHGGKVIDSSPMYGHSEEVAGDLLTSGKDRGKFFLATKVWTTGKEQGIRQINDSFEKLRTEKIDLLQIHNLVDWRVHLKTLRSLKEEGKINYIGITHYHSGAYAEAEKIIRSEKIDFLQINYSLRKREAEATLLPLCQEKGLSVLINQPFESGTLFSAVKGKELPSFAIDMGCNTWSQFFLKFILGHSAVTCVIPGTGKVAHMKDNVYAGTGRYPDAKEKNKMIDFIYSL